MVLTIFWGIGINTSTGNFAWMMVYGVVANYVFCSQGYFVGITVDSEDGCKVVNMFVVLLFSTCNGVLANLKGILILQQRPVAPGQRLGKGPDFFALRLNES